MADFDPVSYMMGQKAAGGGGGGSSTLSGLTDVDISNPSDGQTLVFNSTTGKWENGAGGGGGVLIVRANEETGALDKTWSELHAAGLAVLIIEDQENSRIRYILGNTRAEDGDVVTYFADFFDVYTLDGAGEAATLLFKASSPNSYPTLNPTDS